MSWDGLTERRRYPRASVRLQLSLEGETNEAREAAELETLNLSAGGFYCSVTRSFEPLTRLGLCFVFPAFGRDYEEPRTVECEAVVIRCEPVPEMDHHFRLAACFTRLAAEDRRYLTEFVGWYREVHGDYEQGAAGQPGSGEAAA